MLALDVSDGFWVLGEFDQEKQMVAFPRHCVCPSLRRVISHARQKFAGSKIVMGDAIFEIASNILPMEDWCREGWENPQDMIGYFIDHAVYGIL